MATLFLQPIYELMKKRKCEKFVLYDDGSGHIETINGISYGWNTEEGLKEMFK